MILVTVNAEIDDGIKYKDYLGNTLRPLLRRGVVTRISSTDHRLDNSSSVRVSPCVDEFLISTGRISLGADTWRASGRMASRRSRSMVASRILRRPKILSLRLFLFILPFPFPREPLPRRPSPVHGTPSPPPEQFPLTKAMVSHGFTGSP